LRTERLWRSLGGAVAVSTVVITAACGSSGTNATSGTPSRPAAPSRAPAASGSPGSPGSSGPVNQPEQAPLSAAQQAAESVQGTPAEATAAQVQALRHQSHVIAKMSAQQRAGQRVIYSYNGLSAPAALLADIRHGLVGGVVFFSFNISSRAQISGVVRQLIEANASAGNPARNYPLLLMTDQEGGLVRRLPGAPAESEAQIGAAADPAAAAAAAGSGAAANLSGVGMNVNLAPVLDVYRQPGDFDDQFQRSYSMNPEVAAAAGAAFVSAQQAGGVASTVKHFPGLGAAARTQDTDLAPVVIDVPAQTLRAVDELPFLAAIKAGTKLAMVSWATYPALAPKLPAGLAPAIVQDELERRDGFAGVTITDALGAGALRSYGSLQNRTMLAARAGMDALLCTATKPLPGSKCVAGLETGYSDGALPKTAFEGQLAQLLQLRASLRA
jgi:beta-N-acetylhexosaminidase